MRAEHTHAPDSRTPFTASNYGVTTSSEQEWLFVVEAAEGLKSLGREAYAEEAVSKLPDRSRCRRPRALAEVLQEMGRVNERLRAVHEPTLIRQEVVAARLCALCAALDPRTAAGWFHSPALSPLPLSLSLSLSLHWVVVCMPWRPLVLPSLSVAVSGHAFADTGPLFVKYNGVLRGLHSDSPFLRAQMVQLCCPSGVAAQYAAGETSFEAALGTMNKYTTTIHAINSAIVKSAKLTFASKIYRGVAGFSLPVEFWEPNAVGVRGGVERAFLSTTTERSVAMGYASGGASMGLVFEIQQGMVDRGADVSWLSQYPHEKETLFGPLTGLEVQGTRVDGGMVVIEARLSVNLNALTIEQVISKLQRSHVQLLDSMADELHFAGAPIAALAPFARLQGQAQVRGREYFNDAGLFKIATNEAIDAGAASLALLGHRSTWEQVEGPPEVVAKRMRQCAELLAEKEEHEAAALLLVLAVERCPVPTHIADSVDTICKRQLVVPSKLHRAGLEAFDHFLATEMGGRNANKQPWPLTVRLLVKHYTGDQSGNGVTKAICRMRDVDHGVTQVQRFERRASAAARKGSALLHAASLGDVAGVREALAISGEAAVNHVVANGVTPLMLAARVGAADCVAALLAARADPNLAELPPLAKKPTHTNGMDALTLAVVNKGDEGGCCVEALLRPKADPNSRSRPLVYAAKRGHNTEVRSLLALLRAGADVNTQDSEGKTALMHAGLNSHGAITKVLLEDAEYAVIGRALPMPADLRWRQPGQPALDLESEDDDGYAALHLCTGAINQVNLMLRAGADPNHASGQRIGKRAGLNTGFTPLIEATRGGHRQSVEALLRAGAQVNWASSHGLSPLMLAAGYGDLDVVQQLLAARAAVDAVDDDGSTPMVRCVLGGHEHVVRALRAVGASAWDLMRDGIPRTQTSFCLRGAAGGLGSTITALPESIGECAQLQKLTLDGCARLVALPEAICRCRELRTLSLKGCKSLCSLPWSLKLLTKLRSLDLTDCCSLLAVPECLLSRTEHPLERLVLVGCSNVLVEAGEAAAAGSEIRIRVESEAGVVHAAEAAPFLDKMPGLYLGDEVTVVRDRSGQSGLL